MDNYQRVVIVGGGTAGWMAAAALAKAFDSRLDITLVESDAIGTVGVGEATIPAIRNFHTLLELDEVEFMTAVNGTYKLGIEFINWGSLGDSYFHPFGPPGVDAWAAQFHHYWLRAQALGGEYRLDDYSYETCMAKAGKFSNQCERVPNYAYHFDASLYARLLRAFSEKLGVSRREGKVERVRQNSDSGHIEGVDLDNGTSVDGDFFIDCTGFRGLLIDKTLGADWEDWSHWLRSNRAVAAQSESVAPPAPFTRSMAHTAGWQWHIPLQNRVGNGVVFCNDYLSEDAATDLLLRNLHGAALTEPRVIPFRTGRRREQWKGNCVSMGLSSGFLEPLESTSIHLIQNSIIRLVKLFPGDSIRESEVEKYNRDAADEFEAIRDFIILHYHVNGRTDSPFWRDCAAMDIPDSLKAKIELFRSNGRAFRDNNELFAERSWAAVMIGQGLQPTGYHPFVNNLDDGKVDALMREVRANIAILLNAVPGHEEFLTAQRATT